MNVIIILFNQHKIKQKVENILLNNEFTSKFIQRMKNQRVHKFHNSINYSNYLNLA